MEYFRISKYNPSYRDKKGIYKSNEWTSFSDIGNKVSKEEYINIENNYLGIISQLLKILDIEKLKLISLEKYSEYDELTGNTFLKEDIYKNLKNGNLYNIGDSLILCKGILREYFWGKLEYKDKIHIHFGYDYYMYIGIDNGEIMRNINYTNIFIEKFNSPYRD